MRISILFFLIYFGFVIKASGLDKKTKLEEALKNGQVEMKVWGTGGYTGKVIKSKIKNLSTDTLFLLVEAGRELESEDTTIQNILITHAELLALAPMQEKELSIFGMCSKAKRSSPSDMSFFRPGKMAKEALVKLAEFIDKRNLHESTAAQHAVWVISDNNGMETVSSTNKKKLKELRKILSQLTGKPQPFYSLEYAQDTSRVFSGKPILLRGTMEYTIGNNGMITFGIYDSKGKLVKTYFINQPHNPGPYSYDFDLSVGKLPKGRYLARLYRDGQLFKEEKIEL